jgi:competence ComEA-like helix-hairpin-helix protein
MKKVYLIFSAAVCALMLFTIGFLYLRNHASGFVQLSPYTPATVCQTTAPTEAAFPIDINSANVQSLSAIPGIGQVYAQRIVDYRSANGPFEEVSELLNVPGIGQKRLDAMIPYITIGGNHEDTCC